MDFNEERVASEQNEAELDPGIQELADLAGKMGENGESEYDENGFDANGMHKDTGTKYDPEGYDKDGFDEINVDREGFDREGFGTDDRDRDGYDREGYNEDGYGKDGFNKDGIHQKTGTKYDGSNHSGGYDRNGFDSRGLHKKTGRASDPDGYDKDGYDYRGFDRNGKHRDTGTEFDAEGFNTQNLHKDTGTRYSLDGYDRNGLDKEYYDKDGFKYGWGYDREGYDRNGFNKKGYNREGINEVTGTRFDKNGFDQNGRHESTGEIYDPEGFDITGYNKEGFDRYGFDKDGINKDTGTELDVDGYNKRGLRKERKDASSRSYMFDRQGFRWHKEGDRWVQSAKYNKDGFDRDGLDRYGRDEYGFDQEGYDPEGYDRQGLDKEGYSREFNAKFNRYGVDESGYTKNGEMDPDVQFAIEFAESGVEDQGSYAFEKKMDENDVRKKIAAARKKCPNIDEMISDILLTGNKKRVANIINECNEVIDESISANEFWELHPKLTIGDILSNFLNSDEDKKQFADKTIEGIVMDSDNIEKNIRIFNHSRFDVPGALKGIEDFKKIYTRFSTDGSPEEIKKKQENTKKIFDTMKYFNLYKNDKLNMLLGTRQSNDGGQTWVEFTGENIGEAMEALKKDNKLICLQTVKDYIINNHE